MEEKDKEERDMEEKDKELRPDGEAPEPDKAAGEEKSGTPVTEKAAGEDREDAAAGETDAAAGDCAEPGGNAGKQPPDAEAAPESDNASGTEAASDTEDAPGSEGETDSRGDGRTKTGFFGKKKKKDRLEETVEELTDKLKRSMAEFDNFRKRTEREKSQMYEIGARDVIEKILPVVDNFERGLDAMTEEDKAGGVGQGMEMIYKQLATVLEQLDVKPIEAKGRPFDPDFHNAVIHEENEEAGENEVVEELQKGYTYRGTVVRHSMVKVAN